MVQPPSARRLRRRYMNGDYPLVALKFEDGHEIRMAKGEGKSFDAWAGETIKVIALWDSSSNDREVVATRKAEEFDPAD